MMDVSNPTAAAGRVLVGGVGMVFNCRLMGRGDIGSAAPTSRVGSIMGDIEMFTFVLVNCLGDVAISGVNVSSSTTTGGVDVGIARARAVDGSGGFARAGAVDVPDTSTATGMHVAPMCRNVLPNNLLFNGIDYGLVGVARGRAEISHTTATC